MGVGSMILSGDHGEDEVRRSCSSLQEKSRKFHGSGYCRPRKPVGLRAARSTMVG